MKQTNSAIKFLLAQYRAIFNRAFVQGLSAAVVLTASLTASAASGQGPQAKVFDNAKLGELTETATTVTINGTGTDANNYKNLALSGSATGVTSDGGKEFNITITSGGNANTIKGAGAGDKSKIDLSHSNITIKGDKDATLTIGEKGSSTNPSPSPTPGTKTSSRAGNVAPAPTDVAIKNLNVAKGTLELVAEDKADSTNKTSVTAEAIVLGEAATSRDGANVLGSQGATGATATVKIAKNTSLTASNTLTMNAGSEITVAVGGSVLAGSVVMNDGEVKLGTATKNRAAGATDVATFGSKSGTVEIKKGTLSAVGGASEVLGTVSVTGGTVKTAAGSTLTFKGGVTLDKAATLANSGSLVLEGAENAIAFADASTFDGKSSLTLKNGAKANVSLADLGKLLSGSVQSAQGTSGTIALSDTTEVDLSSGNAIFTAPTQKPTVRGAVDGGSQQPQPQPPAAAAEGSLNAKLMGGDGKLTVVADKAKYDVGDKISADAKNGDVMLSFGELTLGKAATAKATATPFVASGVKLEVKKSLTTTGNKALEIDNGGSLTLNGTGSTIESESITLGRAAGGKKGAVQASSGSLNVVQGQWTTNKLIITSGDATVSNGSTLTLTKELTTNEAGKLTVKDGSKVVAKGVETLSLASGGVVLNGGSSLTVSADKIITADKTLDENVFKTGAIGGTTDTKLVLDSSSEIKMTAEQFKTFRTKTGFKGLFDKIVIDGKLNLPEDGSHSMELGGNGVIGGIVEGYDSIQGTVGSSGVNDNYYVGNVKATEGDTVTLNNGGALTLGNANANGANGQYVTDKDGKVGKVQFTDNNTLVLEGAGGKIGAITNTANGSGSVTIGEGTDVKVESGSFGTENTAGTGTGAGALGKVSVQNGGHLSLDSGSVFANNLSVGNSASVDVGEGKIVAKEHAEINGNITAGSLTLSGTADVNTGIGVHSIAGDAVVDVNDLDLAAGNILTVGKDAAGEDKLGSSASVDVENLTLGSGSILFVDPSFEKKATVFAAQKLNDKAPGVSTADGFLLVGQNAALGIGYNQSQLEGVIAPYLNSIGSFGVDGTFKNAFALNKPLEISSGNGVAVDASLTDEQVKDPAKIKANYANKLVLGEKANLIISDKAFGADKTGTAITFVSGTTAGTVNAEVAAGAGSVITLVGDISKNDTGLKLFGNTTGGSIALKANNKLKVEAAGGLLSTEITDAAGLSGSLALKPDPEVEKLIRTRVSSPVADMFVAYADGKFDGQSGSGYDFVVNNLTAKKYEVVDVAAHAATYAGAQQAAVAAVTTMADAVGARVGSMGAEASAIVATGSAANGGVWLTPMYKSVDADGFGAQGVSYGSDVDLAGVAFGTDTVNGNMRFGAVFNIGSGDSDGKGMGDGLKDEFDYYGFGIYSVMGFGNLALVGDASLNVISHEVEASGLGVKAKADTTAVTMGVTGQYTISTPSVDVVPHLGARFIRLDTDSYDLSSASGAFATTDFDVQNVFSIPLGVSFSKAIEMGGWSLAPSADLSITFNTGDVEADTTTRFHGMSYNLATSTEVLDEVTYGVAVGLGAQYGAFGTQIGINYTGSENTDSFGVNAQARYMF